MTEMLMTKRAENIQVTNGKPRKINTAIISVYAARLHRTFTLKHRIRSHAAVWLRCCVICHSSIVTNAINWLNEYRTANIQSSVLNATMTWSSTMSAWHDTALSWNHYCDIISCFTSRTPQRFTSAEDKQITYCHLIMLPADSTKWKSECHTNRMVSSYFH